MGCFYKKTDCSDTMNFKVTYYLENFIHPIKKDFATNIKLRSPRRLYYDFVMQNFVS